MLEKKLLLFCELIMLRLKLLASSVTIGNDKLKFKDGNVW